VVELAGFAVRHDTAGVRLPRGSIDGDGDGSVGNEPCGHLGLVVGKVVVASDDGTRGLAGVGTAGNAAITRHVWVGSLRYELATAG